VGGEQRPLTQPPGLITLGAGDPCWPRNVARRDGHTSWRELEAFDRSLDVHISRIRAAIEDDPRHPRRIITVRGAGYVFAKSQDA
jgi:hypothetical protein